MGRWSSGYDAALTRQRSQVQYDPFPYELPKASTEKYENLARPICDIMDLIKFFQEVNKLKGVKRKGWVIDGVKNPESVSDHSWMVALMVMIIGKERGDIDLLKTIKMALVHDIAESRTGDIVTIRKWNSKSPKELFEDITKKDKHKREEDALKKLVDMLGRDGKEYFDLLKEYFENETKEAVLVKDIDKLEMCLQALEYELNGNHNRENLIHYFKYSRDHIKDPELLKLLDEIEAMRPKN